MTDDLEDFARYLSLPETATAIMKSIMDDYMAPASYVGEMKVLTVVMRETDQ